MLAIERSFYGNGKDLAYIVLNAERDIAIMIVVGRSAINDDVRDASLGSDQRKGSGGIDRQGRAEGYHQIGFESRAFRPRDLGRIKTLPEADRGRF